MSTAPAKQCRSSRVKPRSVPIEWMAGIRRTPTAMSFIIVLGARITLCAVLANYNGMRGRKNADGNRPSIVVHRRKCYQVRRNWTRPFARAKPMGKSFLSTCRSQTRFLLSWLARIRAMSIAMSITSVNRVPIRSVNVHINCSGIKNNRNVNGRTKFTAQVEH